MKKRYAFRLVFFLSLVSLLLAQNPVFSQEKKSLLLMNPTVGHLSGMVYLIGEEIFPIKNVELKGVYFAKENYDYSLSEQYIRENNLSIRLEKVDEILESDQLFRKNACSSAFEKLFSESAGVIFFGGPDIPPAVYGEKTSTLTAIYDPYRHYFETSFLFHLLGGSQDRNFIPLLEKNPEFMVVGFCLGMQTMNVATGGTLVQDIPLEIYKKRNVEDILELPLEKQHRNYQGNIADSLDLFWGNIHPVKFREDSWVIREGLVKTGEFPVVVSSHHQAAEKTGLNLRIVATSMDGKIIEAMDHEKYPNVFGFQFHPEVPDIYNTNNSYRFRAEEEPSSLRSRIEKGNAYEFHLRLWRKFGEVIYSSDR